MPEEKDSITDVHKVFGDDRQPTQKAKVCYARVSSEHQRDDLERQITDLRQCYQDTKLSVTSVWAQLERRGFVTVTLLERIYSKGVEEVVVTRKACVALDPNLWSGS